MRRFALSLIPLFFVLFLSLFGNLFMVRAVPARKDFVSLSIAIDSDSGFDDLATRLTALDFHNFTFVIWYNSAWGYVLLNSTRVSILNSFGVCIPMCLPYVQMYEPISRKAWVDSAFNDFHVYFGYYPKGFMSFSPDTYTIQYAYDTYNCTYVQGYCFEQYLVDWMTMRGGWQLPYYSSVGHVSKPSDVQGIVVFPHVTWDWKDSFTLGHMYNTHIGNVISLFSTVALAKAYWLKLIDNSLTACSPFGFVSVQWEWCWMSTYNYQASMFDWFASVLANPLYTFWTYEAVAEWFLTNYASNPVYRVSFTAPHSASSVEWYWSSLKRVCRYDGKVMSYVDYAVPCNDKYRLEVQSIDWGTSPTVPSETVDLTVYACIKIDALGGGVLRFGGVGVGQVYAGDLADFGVVAPSLLWYQDSTMFLGVVCLAFVSIVVVSWFIKKVS